MSGARGQYVPRSPNIAATPLRSESERKMRWKVDLPQNENDEQWGGCRQVESAFEKTNQIGEGTYGQVYLATDKKDGSQVALKKIRMDTEKEGFPITAIREIKLLKNLHHVNIINLREIVRSQSHKCNNFKGSIYMVFDYMDHDLTGLMDRLGHNLPVAEMKCYMKQLLRGLTHCHGQNVLHRDLKAANLLTNNSGQLKLADFGLARTYRDRDEHKMTNRVITLWYRPPELLLGSTLYGPEIDMWSVGCIFAELLFGKTLFNGQEESDQLTKIFKGLGTPDESTWPGVSKLPHYHNLRRHPAPKGGFRACLEQKFGAEKVRKLPEEALGVLESMLRLDPKKRISAMEAFKHNFFWSTHPQPTPEDKMPKREASHELDMKRKRQAERGQRQDGQGQGQAQAQAQAHNAAHEAKRQRTAYNANSAAPHSQEYAQHGSYAAPASYGQPPAMAAPAYGGQLGAYAGPMYPQQAAYGQYPGQMAGRPPAHSARPGAPYAQPPARPPPPGARPGYSAGYPQAPGVARPPPGPVPGYGAARPGMPMAPAGYGQGAAPPGYGQPAPQIPAWQRARR